MTTAYLTEGRSRATAPAAFGRSIADRPRVKTHIPDSPRGGEGNGPVSAFLGLFSLGLGAWEALDPRGVGERSGVQFPALLRGYGLREIGAGVGILTARNPAGWLWARVLGDAFDLAAAGAAYAQAASDEQRRKVLQTVGVLVGVTLVDAAAAKRHSAG